MTSRHFSLGRLLITRNALDTLDPAAVHDAIVRHAGGDWGELDKFDRLQNEQALANGGRLFSVYRDPRNVRFYVITEADRSVTTVLLPEDY